jgi:hypothetical protein
MNSAIANQRAAEHHFHRPLHTFRIPSRASEPGPALYFNSYTKKSIPDPPPPKEETDTKTTSPFQRSIKYKTTASKVNFCTQHNTETKF